MRDVNLNGSCSASDTITLDLHGKTITSEDKFFNVNKKLTVKDSSEGGGTQALNVKFSVGSNGTLAVDDSYTGDISYVELRTGGALEAYTGTIQELLLGKGNGTGYSVKLWKDNAHCCTVKQLRWPRMLTRLLPSATCWKPTMQSVNCTAKGTVHGASLIRALKLWA